MDVYKPKTPDIEGRIDQVLRLLEEQKDILSYVEDTNRPKYLFWNKVRHKPRPDGVSAEDFWALIKLLRRLSPNRIRTEVRNEGGEFFTWQPVPGLDYFLHQVDMELGGFLASATAEDPTQRQRFIARGITDEAIASSQLEGANTTRRVARRMLKEKRQPKNNSEQMILNNYQAMLDIDNNLKDQELSVDLLLELHETITNDTIDAGDVGRFRSKQDNIWVWDQSKEIIYHIPPSVKFLKQEMKRFIRFANDDLAPQRFIHPVIKAIILHFWLAFLHPFVDGNGRLARIIFNWYLARKNYWAIAYLPVSKMIRNSPAQYRDAYAFSEHDDNDLTYFIDYNTSVISKAMEDLKKYITQREIENRKLVAVVRQQYGLNDRQIQLLKFFNKNEGATTTIKTHSQISGVSRMTARKDLERLEELGLLSSRKVGYTKPFSATDKLTELF